MTQNFNYNRIAILWTIVIVFISQLFHCAYTNSNLSIINSNTNNNKRNSPHALSSSINQNIHQPRQQLQAQFDHEHLLGAANNDFNQDQTSGSQNYQQQQNNDRETYEELLSSSSGGNGAVAGTTFDNEPLSAQAQTQSQAQSLVQNQGLARAPEQGLRERCKELISFTLLSFKDLSPYERASEELDCAALQEQIAHVNANRQVSSRQQPVQPRARASQQPAEVIESGRDFSPRHSQVLASSQAFDNFPLAPIYNSDSSLSQQQRPRQFNNIQLTSFSNVSLAPAPSLLETSRNPLLAPTSWQPRQQQRQESYVNQMQQLLMLQHQQRQRLQQEANNQQQFYTTTQSPLTTLATTFESLFETTLAPTTTTTTQAPTTTTTTTTSAPALSQPRLRVGGNQNRRKPKQIRTSSTTTTSTTTTAKPSTLADYADNSEVSTDYYDEYDDQSQATTTTTTTQRPARNRSKKRQRMRTSTTTSTSPKPSTTTTTLSPGYQPRPDGRVIDYMADPNFPRELKGADLTNYPFYISVPEKIDFECKGRHDGYYANIDLHCQIYHHCAVGNRYDFLCPNYTLFDQTTFTCRFINTVDCVGSEKHFDRNNALYVEKDEKEPAPASSQAATSAPTSTTTTTTAPSSPKLNIQMSHRSGHQHQNQNQAESHGKQPKSTPAPVSALDLIQQQSRGKNTDGSSGGRKRRANHNS